MKQRKATIQHFKASIKDKIYLVISGIILVTFLTNFDIKVTLRETQEVNAAQQIAQNTVIREIAVNSDGTVLIEDPRIAKLKAFLESKHSPLAPYSELIIEQADKYDIGWTKIVAISQIESDFAKKLPNNSHNAWGLGGSKFMYFSNWEEGIKYASWLIGTHYKQNENQAIKSKYCPASANCNPEWANVVTRTTRDILALEDKR